MANHLYGYDVPYGGPGLYGPRSAASAFESSLGDGMRYHRSGDFPAGGYGSGRVWGAAPWSVMDGLSSSVEPPVPGVKRPAEAAYHSAILGTHSAYGQSEALFATNPFAKRIRYESTSNLPMYPQRPGEKDCAHYMLTRACKFGDSCKFDHPLWVPEGGIPDWKEVPAIPSTEPLPEKPGEPDCPYFLKTQRCKFGPRCKFNHPKEKVQYLSNNADGVPGNMDISVLPERPSESACAYYMKTGKCKFGAMCKFHHPKDIELPPPQDNPTEEQNGLAIHDKVTTAAKPFVPVAPAMLHNSKGLPLRPGEADCPFYLKTGSCKYGATCRFNHPDRNSINPPVASALGKTLLASPAASLPFGDIGLSAQLFPNINSRITRITGSQSLLEHGMGPTPTVYPQRAGQTECDFYMKTGECKFGERCKFHHPIDRTAPTQSMLKQTPQVKLTLAGLPRREDAIICPFYMKTGTCKYGATCRYDHPPPGEAIAKATVKGGPASAAGDTTTGEATTAEGRDANAQ